jgi:integrase
MTPFSFKPRTAIQGPTIFEFRWKNTGRQQYGVVPYMGRKRRYNMSQHDTSCDTVTPAIDSTAKGDNVARRRHQEGHVYLNDSKTDWYGRVREYVIGPDGTQKAVPRDEYISPATTKDGIKITKTEARNIFAPFVYEINRRNLTPSWQGINATFEELSKVWERDFLSKKKASTQASMKSQTKRLVEAFGSKEMRRIGTDDLQRVVSAMEKEGKKPKTIRNLWITVRLIWRFAKTRRYVDHVIEKPELLKCYPKDAPIFRIESVGKLIANSQGDFRTFQWLTAETGARLGEMCALKLEDVREDRIRIDESVWNGQFDVPKNGRPRTIAISPQLSALLTEQVNSQREKKHSLLFSTKAGAPWDGNLLRRRKLQPLIRALGIPMAGFHAFRHFSNTHLRYLGVSLKVRQQRLGHSSGDITTTVYDHAEWLEHIAAAKLLGKVIEEAVNFVSLSAVQQEGPPSGHSEALDNSQKIGCGGQI